MRKLNGGLHKLLPPQLQVHICRVCRSLLPPLLQRIWSIGIAVLPIIRSERGVLDAAAESVPIRYNHHIGPRGVGRVQGGARQQFDPCVGTRDSLARLLGTWLQRKSNGPRAASRVHTNAATFITQK